MICIIIVFLSLTMKHYYPKDEHADNDMSTR